MYVKRLADAFRAAGKPVLYVTHILKPDYSVAAFPYWGYSQARETARTASRGRGVPR